MVGDTGWADKDVPATGVDLNGDWWREILVRDRVTGSLSLYSTVENANWELGGWGNPVVLDASGWSAAERPQVLVLGDSDGDWELEADLVTTTAAGGLTRHRATETGAPGAPVAVASTGYGTDLRLI